MEPTQKLKSSPRDVFLHLLAVVALYASATAFLTLAFQLVNVWFPDVLSGSGYYAYAGARSAIRWALASLIIVFPVYLWTARFLRREYEAEPEKKELRVRKWLLSFTLFVAALAIISDLVSLLSHFLEGELTARFVLKVIAVAFTAAAIGGYYLWELKDRKFTATVKYALGGVFAVVLASIVTGFFYAGSPAEERLRRMDMRRVNDLQMMQSEIVSYWQAKERLPENADALTDSISGYMIPIDPTTRVAYEYRATGPLSFELCAMFDRVSEEDDASLAMPRLPTGQAGMPFENGADMMSWGHGMGRHCFVRTIDPDIYPPLSKR